MNYRLMSIILGVALFVMSVLTYRYYDKAAQLTVEFKNIENSLIIQLPEQAYKEVLTTELINGFSVVEIKLDTLNNMFLINYK